MAGIDAIKHWVWCGFVTSLITLPGVNGSVLGFDLDADWPQFRGPGGQGHAVATDLPTTWSETENVTWRTPLPGRGWSSPVIQGDQIWMTTAFETQVTEEERKARLASKTNTDSLAVSGTVRLHALCVNRQTGKLEHDIELLVKEHPQPVHNMNSYASPTAILSQGLLFCCFGAYGSVCVDTKTGTKKWENVDLVIDHENGPGSTPVLWNDKYILHCDGSDQQYIVALDANTGQVAWKVERTGKMNDDPQLKKAYGTPLLLQQGEQTVLASPAANWVYGYDPATGRELWKVEYGDLGFSTVPRPVMGNGLLYVVTGFMKSQLLAVQLGNDLQSPPTVAWRFDKQVPTIPSPLLVGAHLFMVSNTGIVTCLNAKTGELMWRERLGGNFAASPLHADGKIFLCDREGFTTILPDDGTYSILAKNPLEGEIMASPAALGKTLFLRTDKALYRIEKP